MKKLLFIISIAVIASLNILAQGYRNPVLPGFHADPSVCTNGKDFYLVNSTFQYFPGVPVFHSKDLIHWEQVGNCLSRKSQLDLSGLYTQNQPELGWTNAGIYAPTIRYHEGRETMLAPVRWDKDAWPVVNGNGTIAIDMKCNTLPEATMPLDPVREEFNYVKRDVPADSYSSIGLPWGWMSIGNPDYSRYSLTERKGWLRLHPTSTPLDAATSPTFAARRQTELRFSATTLIDASHLAEGSQAGITAYAAPLNHYDVIVERKNGKLLAQSNIRVGALSHAGQPVELKDAQAYIRISSDKDYYYMQVSADGKSFTTLSKMDYRYLSTEVIGGFTGVMLGLFAQGDDGYADFDWFEYTTE